MRPTQTVIPERRYFRIGEVSALTGVEAYVLRYWETEFRNISPARSRSGQRLYRKRDIENILEIKDLLHEQRYTIAGARQYLKERHEEPRLTDPDKHTPLTLQQFRKELIAIRDLLET